MSEPFTRSARLFRIGLPIGVLCMGAWASAAEPFNSATVTKVENTVAVGNLRDARGAQRPAEISAVIKASDYLQTQLQSRAELEFGDRSIIRVGQNTIFSFDAESRTLSLQKGAMLFYIPHGGGGGRIKTPSLTAAVTGTLGEVGQTLDRGIIKVRNGEVEAKGKNDTEWQTVHEKEMGIVGSDGHLQVLPFTDNGGALLAMGPLPETPAGGVDTSPLNVNTRVLTFPWDRYEHGLLNAERLKEFINPPRVPKPNRISSPKPAPSQPSFNPPVNNPPPATPPPHPPIPPPVVPPPAPKPPPRPVVTD